MDLTPNIRVPHYPAYEQARQFIRILDGQPQRLLSSTREKISRNIGTPQDSQNWTRPDEWIALLDGEEREFAFYIWRESQQQVNPRYLTGVWSFASNYGLLAVDKQGIFHLTDSGKDFIQAPLGKTAQTIDYQEGLLKILLIISEQGPAKRPQVLPEFVEFLQMYSNYRSTGASNNIWAGRIHNLRERNLLSPNKGIYQITPQGLKYLESANNLLESLGHPASTDAESEIRKLINKQQKEVRSQLQKTLDTIDPYALEHLVKQLLEAMDYENVEVTKKSGDGGVDVVADVEVGISRIREVVQVKRHQKNIERAVVDQLRGSLYRFNAHRGTIITVRGFSKGAQGAVFEPNVAPITLIDGERLIDLLIEYEIGIRKRPLQLIEFELKDFTKVLDESTDPSS